MRRDAQRLVLTVRIRCALSAVEMEQSLHGVEQAVRSSLASFFAKRFQRRMQQLVDDALHAVLDHLPILVAEVLKLGRQSLKFFFADVVPLLSQTFDDRPGCTVVNIVHEVVGLVVDDLQSVVDLFNSRSAITFAGRFKIVDVVQKDVVVDIARVGGEVSWRAQIEHKHRLAASRTTSGPESCGVDDRLRRAGRADNYVSLAKPVVE